MANEVLQKQGTIIKFIDSGGDFAFTTASLAAAAARQSIKFDLGATFARQFAVRAAFDSGTAQVAGETVDLYIGWGHDNATFPGGLGVADAAYTGYSTNLADSLLNLTYIGAFVWTAVSAQAHISDVGKFSAMARYGVLVAVNNGTNAISADAADNFVEFIPIIDEVQ